MSLLFTTKYKYVQKLGHRSKNMLDFKHVVYLASIYMCDENACELHNDRLPNKCLFL